MQTVNRQARRIASIALSILVAAAPRARAQAATSGIQATRSRHISVANATHPHVESFVAVDPRDSRHLLATSIVVIGGKARSFPYASFDAGATWAQGRIIGDSVVTEADPILAFGRSGTAFFTTLASVNGGGRTAVARSTDGGRTWRWTTILPAADREFMTSDHGSGPFGGRIYFTGTGVYRDRDGKRAVAPFLARSDDDGRTFPFRSVIAYDRGGADPNAPLNAIPLEPLVAPGGVLLMPLQGGDTAEIARLAQDSLTSRKVGLIVSDDGGESFGPARYAPTSFVSITGSARRRLRATSAFGNVRTAVDASAGPYRNRLYFVTTDYDRARDRYVVRVWHTPDFGKSWATTVASDAPRGDVANPAVSVNRDGIVAITWNDRRDDPAGKCWQLYAALSFDGGDHFLPAQRLSRAPTCLTDPRNWVTFGAVFNSDQSGEYLAHFQTGATVPARFPNGGDTQGLTADGSGAFHAAWISGERGVMQLWYTGFQVDPTIAARLRSVPKSSSDSQARFPGATQMEDVTHDIGFAISGTTLDFTSRTYSITLAIENKSGRVLRGPLRAEMRRFLDPAHDNGLGLKNLAVANADSGGAGIGATWIFAIDGGALAPGARTKSRVLRFSFEGGVPEFPEGYLTAGFRVYAPAKP